MIVGDDWPPLELMMPAGFEQLRVHSYASAEALVTFYRADGQGWRTFVHCGPPAPYPRGCDRECGCGGGCPPGVHSVAYVLRCTERGWWW